MNYKLHYNNLLQKYGFVNRPINTNGYERHHIIPKALGGNNDKSNLIYLTGRQHLLAHWLLFKIHNSPEMAMAFFMMRANKSNYILNKIEIRSSNNAMNKYGMLCKAVKTPLGIFKTYLDAAEAHKIPASTFQDIIRRHTEGFEDLGSIRKMVSASKENHGMSRRIRTPLGIFPYVGAASTAHGISNKTVSRRCLENPDEYYYLDPPKQSNRIGSISCNRKQVKTPIGIFNSTMEAANALGICRETLRYKIKSVNMPEYCFVEN